MIPGLFRPITWGNVSFLVYVIEQVEVRVTKLGTSLEHGTGPFLLKEDAIQN